MTFRGETQKAELRRKSEGWFDKYAPSYQTGIDIGCGRDPLNQTFRRWDILLGDGSAEEMDEVPDGIFQTVYASHILEHLDRPLTALQNWYRILRPGGNLIIVVPHRDLYEGRKNLPSQWNQEHRTYWLPDRDEDACTLSLSKTVTDAIPTGKIVELQVLSSGWTMPNQNEHPSGEYSIEIIVFKAKSECVHSK